MDPASYCVYNATRNALLSERVISVSEPQTPAQLLALVMNGPGRDPHFCIRLNNVAVAPEIPRLFAFDVAYLDSEQRILAIADVGPGTPFPPISEEVTTILFLSDQLLPNSNSEPGDIIRICTGAELAALLRAAAQFQAIDSPPHRFESAMPQATPDPFDGSLIYLPTSGTPQVREMFVSPAARSPELVDRMQSKPLLPDPFASVGEVEIPIEQALEQTVLSDEVDDASVAMEPITILQAGPSPQETPPAARFSESALSPAPSEAANQEEARQTQTPAPSQLPFNLRAVIELVDEQLRREQRQEEEAASHIREPNEAAREPLPHFGVSANEQSAQQRSEAAEMTTTPAPLKTRAETRPIVESPPIEPPPLTPAAPELVPPPAPFAPPPAAAEAGVNTTLPVEPAPAAAPEPARVVGIPAKEKLPFAARVQRWLSGESVSLNGNRRRGQRVAMSGLVAFYFTGGAPKPHEIVNISSSGLYLRSKELWSPNTLVRMTLEREDAAGAEKRSISVLARVVRVDEGGIGHEFVTTEVLARLNARDFLPSQGTNRKELDRFLASSK
ncbi:PilZ domain-containing protein [Occallatibacter savannae]|uniref:PilZ domain-containing protein n=1 Tax=Occallatibacter savannae TaxID=1002691 RepID=UPI000D68BE64|nr:PilZ domain-containing protein [Occallatibacter savannae]